MSMNFVSESVAKSWVKSNPTKYRINSVFLLFPTFIFEELKWLTYINVLQQKTFEQDSIGNTWYGWYNIAYIGE